MKLNNTFSRDTYHAYGVKLRESKRITNTDDYTVASAVWEENADDNWGEGVQRQR